MLEATKYSLKLKCRTSEAKESSLILGEGGREKSNEIWKKDHLRVTNGHRSCYSTAGINCALPARLEVTKNITHLCVSFIVSQ